MLLPFKVSYERWNVEEINNGCWEIKEKCFATKKEAEQFIRRIQDNIIVNRIWLG